MRYELMFPAQIRQAIDEAWPLVLPVGVLEYHSEHLAVGVDGVLVVRALEALEREMPLVLLPPFFYGAASYVVEPPERNGTVQVDSTPIHGFAKELFRGLLRVGFRNIHAVIHHQSENFAAGMPTDLALKLAGREVVLEWQEREKGRGWWGDNRNAAYYGTTPADNPFNWIRVHPFMDDETQREFPIDHAGQQETSLMMAFCPEGVELARLSQVKWYTKNTLLASPEYGQRARQKILAGLRRALQE